MAETCRCCHGGGRSRWVRNAPVPVLGTLWDARWLAMAGLVASWSKDPSTQVGAVVVGPKREVRAVGYNGFPRGVDDTQVDRWVRPPDGPKYQFTEHAERNAVFNASFTGTTLDGCTIYVTHAPCADCARAIIQAGIKEVVFPESEPGFAVRWGKDNEVASIMFDEAQVRVRVIARP